MNKKIIIPSDLEAKYKDWHFSPAVESGGFVFISGCTGAKVDKTISSNVEDQIRQAFTTVGKSLVEAGLDFSDIVEITTHHVGLRKNLEKFKLIKDEFIKEPYPAWTAVGVYELAVEGAVIEISATARKANA